MSNLLIFSYAMLVLFVAAVFFSVLAIVKSQKQINKNVSDCPIIRKKFPKILANRIILNRCIQGRVDPPSENDPCSLIILYCFDWSQSVEGSKFWNDIHDLYEESNTPLSSEILEVFKNHNISIGC